MFYSKNLCEKVFIKAARQNEQPFKNNEIENYLTIEIGLETTCPSL